MIEGTGEPGQRRDLLPAFCFISQRKRLHDETNSGRVTYGGGSKKEGKKRARRNYTRLPFYFVQYITMRPIIHSAYALHWRAYGSSFNE